MSADERQPEPEGDPRPWEEPGVLRLDFEPHRGRLLQFLGAVTLVGSWLSAGLLAPATLPLGVAVCVLAARDLKRMRAGRMDPAGAPLVCQGRQLALGGLFLGVGGLAIALWLLWLGTR